MLSVPQNVPVRLTYIFAGLLPLFLPTTYSLLLFLCTCLLLCCFVVQFLFALPVTQLIAIAMLNLFSPTHLPTHNHFSPFSFVPSFVYVLVFQGYRIFCSIIVVVPAASSLFCFVHFFFISLFYYCVAGWILNYLRSPFLATVAKGLRTRGEAWGASQKACCE